MATGLHIKNQANHDAQTEDQDREQNGLARLPGMGDAVFGQVLNTP